MMEKTIILGFIIFFIMVLVGYVAYCAYIVYWNLIADKVEKDFECMLECKDDNGDIVLVHGYSIPRSKGIINNDWIFEQYKKKFKV